MAWTLEHEGTTVAAHVSRPPVVASTPPMAWDWAPSRKSKSPPMITRLPSGVAARAFTDASAVGAQGSSVPPLVTARRFWRGVPAADENVPPTYNVFPWVARALTWPFGRGFHPGTSAPVAVSK